MACTAHIMCEAMFLHDMAYLCITSYSVFDACIPAEIILYFYRKKNVNLSGDLRLLVLNQLYYVKQKMETKRHSSSDKVIYLYLYACLVPKKKNK